MEKEKILHKHNGIVFTHTKDEILSSPMILTELEVIILYQISQKHKNKCYVISFISGILKKLIS